MTPTFAFTSELISRPSVTPVDGGCQDLLIAYLVNLAELSIRGWALKTETHYELSTSIPYGT